ncbi:MAG TPA: hypothetical protein VFS30_13120 [Dehalococcoidia bacterium]|nr:hypothetical protein [Dehalococcoidia bacterium]
MTQTSAADQGQAELQRLYILLVDIFRGGLAGTLAGVLFLGAGGRIVMRISALLNPDARGFLTESENVVGEITLGGTVALVVVGGAIFGLAAGTVWVLVREWLPREITARTSLAAILAAVTGSAGVIAADNSDFRVLEPQEAHVAMFLLLLLLTGAATALIDRALESRLPASALPAGLFGGLAGVGLVFAIPALAFFYFLNPDTERPPVAAGIALCVLAIPTIAGWTRYYATGADISTTRPVWERYLGRAALLLFAAIAALYLAAEVEAIV